MLGSRITKDRVLGQLGLVADVPFDAIEFAVGFCSDMKDLGRYTMEGYSGAEAVFVNIAWMKCHA